MSNFLDLDDLPEEKPEAGDLRELITRIPLASPKPHLHPDISDRLAVQHGFTSRDHSASPPPSFAGGRRQPRGRAEETKQLSIRMPLSLYNDFLAFADRERLTYNEAIRALLDKP